MSSMMKVEYINPFVESVSNLFSTMLGCGATCGKLCMSERLSAGNHILGIIGVIVIWRLIVRARKKAVY